MTKSQVIAQARTFAREGLRAVKTLNIHDHRDQISDTDTPCFSVYMGSWLHHAPSGKYYTPWASSNVDSCRRCNGGGCSYCGFVGSREAHFDEIWRDTVDAYFVTYSPEHYSVWLTNGDGDPLDLFVCRSLTILETKIYEEESHE